MMRTVSTVPAWPNNSLRSLSVVSNDRFPTYNFFVIELPLSAEMKCWKLQEAPNASRARAADPTGKLSCFPHLAYAFPQQRTYRKKHRHDTHHSQASRKPEFVPCFILLYPSAPNCFVDLGVLAGLQHEFCINSN